MKDDKRLLKVSRELSIELRHKVFILYEGNTYGNLGKEIEEAIRNHIVTLDRKIAEKNAKKQTEPKQIEEKNSEQKEKSEENTEQTEKKVEQKGKKRVKLILN